MPHCLLLSLALLLACDTQPAQPSVGLQGPSFMTSAWSEWSDPVHLDPPVNTACQDQTPTLSKDELSLYYTPNNDVSPELSPDGDLLFFARFVGSGRRDIYLAWRAGKRDGDEWNTPVGMGPDVNTDTDEDGPTFIRHEGDGDGTLFFYRGSPPVTTDLYSVRVTKDGETLGPAVVMAGLNSIVEDNHAGVRRDGREIFFNSRRPGGAGFDIWVATRGNVHDPWSTPVNVGAPVNHQFADFHPSISFDGRTLVFISGATRGGLGGFDIWMTTRAPLED